VPIPTPRPNRPVAGTSVPTPTPRPSRPLAGRPDNVGAPQPPKSQPPLYYGPTLKRSVEERKAATQTAFEKAKANTRRMAEERRVAALKPGSPTGPRGAQYRQGEAQKGYLANQKLPVGMGEPAKVVSYVGRNKPGGVHPTRQDYPVRSDFKARPTGKAPAAVAVKKTTGLSGRPPIFGSSGKTGAQAVAPTIENVSAAARAKEAAARPVGGLKPAPAAITRGKTLEGSTYKKPTGAPPKYTYGTPGAAPPKYKKAGGTTAPKAGPKTAITKRKVRVIG
jgi:hypothetical protein